MSSVKKEEFKSDELSLKEAILKGQFWAKYVLSKWFFIGIIAGIGAVRGLYGEYYKKPSYKAKITFVVENAGADAGGGQMGGLASQFGLDMGGGGGETFSGATLQELMTSRAMIQKALLSPVEINGKKQSFADFYIENKELRKHWVGTSMSNLHFPSGEDPQTFTLDQNRIMNVIYSQLSKKDLSVNMKKAGISYLEVASENELFAKYFSEQLLRVVGDFYISTKTKKAYENFLILKTQLDSMKRVLNVGVSSVAASVDANPNPNRALSAIGATTQRKQIDVQANQAFYVQMIQNLESAKISLRKETPLLQVVDKPVLPLEVTGVDRKYAFIQGGFIGAILAIVFFVIRKMLKDILK